MGWMADEQDQSDSTAKSKRTDMCVCSVVWVVGDVRKYETNGIRSQSLTRRERMRMNDEQL